MSKIIFLSGGAREQTLEFLLKNDICIVGVITPFPSEKNDRFLGVVKAAQQNGIPVSYADKRNLDRVIEQYQADVLLSCGYSYVIPAEVIQKFAYAINVHPTLLPKYRGYRSGPYILINGEKESGVTVHFLAEELDKGDIILQEKFSLSVFETPKSLKRKTDSCERNAVLKALKMIADGNVVPQKQDESQATTYNYMRTPEDSKINWNEPLKNLYNQIRACDPDQYPAFFYVNGEKVYVRLWRQNKPEAESDMI